MTRETRIGLIVGLAFIVLFGVVLTERGPSGETPDGKDDRIAKGFYVRAPVTPPPQPQPHRQVIPLVARRRTEAQDPSTARRAPQPPRGERREPAARTTVPSPPRVTPQPTAPTAPPTRGGSREMTIEELAAARGMGQRADRSRVYVTRRGDNLIGLARKFYRTPSRKAVMKIFNANRTVLQSPDSLGVGVKIVIPN